MSRKTTQAVVLTSRHVQVVIMRTSLRVPKSFLGLLGLLIWSSSTLAQSTAETSKMKVQPQRQDNVLHVYVSPYDANGRFVSGIPRDKFQVAINGQPAEIVAFSDEGFNKHKKFAAVIVLDVQRDDAFEARKQLAAGIAHMTSAKDYELVHLVLAGPGGTRPGGEWTNALTAAQAIRATQPEAGTESQIIEATGTAIGRAYELDKFRPALFVIAGPSSRTGSISRRGAEDAVPIYLFQSGNASNALLEAQAAASRGSSRAAPAENEVDRVSREVVTEARKRLSDQYVFSVKASGAIPFYFKVTVTYPTGDGMQTLWDESIPRWMVLTPAVSVVVLVVLGSIMFASYRRVLGKLKSGTLDPSQPIPEQLHPGVTHGFSEKIQLAADRVTVRLMRMDSAPVTTPKLGQDEPTKASDDDATIARSPRMGAFMVVGELAPGQPIRFEVKDSVTVGRGSCDLVLADQSVSRKHGRLYLEAGQPMVEDSGSTNGTRVNGTGVTGPTRLKQGDVVEFGDIRLTVELGGQQAAGPSDTVRR